MKHGPTLDLCHALAIELGSSDFNPDNVPSISTLVSCCQGLITVDKEPLAVRLIHFTLQEYLAAHHDIFQYTSLNNGRDLLDLPKFRTGQGHFTPPLPGILDKPFLEYCSVYWGVHAKRELSDSARSLALQLFQG